MSDKRHQRRFGLGLRRPHYASFVDGSAPVDFVEVISENFMVDGGRPLATLARVREHYPVALHGVSMAVGSALGTQPAYLARLKALADRIDPLFVSDHLCWTGASGFNSHDLLPLPYTAEALLVAARNIGRAQEHLGRRILIENPSSYVTFAESTFSEAEFLAELCAVSGCGLLLDVNNVFVSARNHGFDPLGFIEAISGCDVLQIHLAGHDPAGELIIDTHDRKVCDEVWELYRHVASRFPHAATMIERDDDIPPLEELLDELDTARATAGCAPRLAA
jgi:uncharacterized protein